MLLPVDAQKTENPPPATQVQRFAMTFLSSQDPRTELPQLYREPDCYHAFGRQMLDKSGRHVESDIVLRQLRLNCVQYPHQSNVVLSLSRIARRAPSRTCICQTASYLMKPIRNRSSLYFRKSPARITISCSGTTYFLKASRTDSHVRF